MASWRYQRKNNIGSAKKKRDMSSTRKRASYAVLKTPRRACALGRHGAISNMLIGEYSVVFDINMRSLSKHAQYVCKYSLYGIAAASA